MTSDEERFLRELDLFRGETEAAAQHLYAYLAIHAVAKRRKRVLSALNNKALFWNTVAGALQTSSLITLGRVFDQNSAHNVDVLLGIAAKTTGLFSRAALAKRKHPPGGLAPSWLDAFVARAHEPGPADFRHLRAAVARARRVYDARFRDLRGRVFAHAELHGPTEVGPVSSKANINELKRLLSSLASIHDALFNMFWNGQKPVLQKLRYAAKPPKGQMPGSRPHERISAEVEQVLIELTRPNKRMEPTRQSSRAIMSLGRAAHLDR